MTFDPSEPVTEDGIFQRQDWASSEFGHQTEQEVPANMPPPRGTGFTMRANVDADHAADTTTR